MNSEFYEKEVPVLSREDAIAILNTPDEELDVLITVQTEQNARALDEIAKKTEIILA